VTSIGYSVAAAVGLNETVGMRVSITQLAGKIALSFGAMAPDGATAKQKQTRAITLTRANIHTDKL